MGYLIDYKYFKFIAALGGYFIGDIVGAISAFFLVREIVDNKDSGVDILELSLLRLSSLMIRADGDVHPDEVKTVRKFFIKTFGQTKSDKLFKELKNSPPIPNDLNSILSVIKERLNPNQTYSVILLLFEIAAADGQLFHSEEKFIYDVGFNFGFKKTRLDQIKGQYFHSSDSKQESNTTNNINQKYYDILGLKNGASIDEIKKAYRRLAKEYHPDKLAGVNESIKKIAEEKFREVQEAYEKLNK